MILAFLLAWSIRLAQVARRQAREIAAASAAKSRFLANISREFGNPLNSINGFGHVLMSRQDGELNPEQEEDLRAILAGGQRMAALMRELLQLAQLEAGATTVSIKTAAGGEILEDLRRQFEPQAAENGLRLRVEADARDGAVRADPERLRQALSYLVANAVKFAPRGEVVLEQRADASEAVFRVRDSGAGIPPEEMGHIFEPFWQSPRLDGIKKTEGLGLGLFLAKRLVELQGGTVAVEPAAGKGTTFAVRLPRAGSAEPRTAGA
jgi:signal transduction histidine kinase